MRLIIMGPPGAGKGTQAALVAAEVGIPVISTGTILRADVAERTALGLMAKSYLDAGDYVPDELINLMVRHRLAAPDAVGGFLLDGYPRTLAQVAELDATLDGAGHALDAVLALTVDQGEVVDRLLRRAGIEGRSDDSAEVITRRLEVYADQTAPLLARYRERGLLHEVDGAGEVDSVTLRIRSALGAR